MKILVFLALVCGGFARPDIGLGYHYQPPATSYGVPSGSIQGVNDQKYYQHVQHQQENFAPVSTPSRSFEAPIREHSSFTGSTSSGPQISGQFSTQFNQGQAPSLIGNTRYAGGSTQGSSTFGSTVGTGSFSTTSFGAAGSNAGINNANVQQRFGDSQVEVQKHLYFYTAPEEPAEVRSRINIPVAPPKKNIKIIFIKAPTYRAPQIQIPIQQQNLEKTVVYVLVKKQDDIQDIQIPEQPQQKPVKPEVFFIKYKNQQEAEHAIHQVQQGAAAVDGTSVIANPLEGDREFISNIGQDASGSAPSVNFINQPSQDLDSRGNFDFTLGGNLPHNDGSAQVQHHEVQIQQHQQQQYPTNSEQQQQQYPSNSGVSSGVSYDSSTSAPVDIGGSSGSAFSGSFSTSGPSVGFQTSGSISPSTESSVEQRFNQFSQNTPQVHQTYGVPN